MSIVFGKIFTTSFTVHDGDGNTVPIYALVSARIYADAPTEAQIEDSAEALGGWEVINSTAAAGATDELTITYPALTDPDEHATGNATYYEVLSFTLDNGGPTKFLKRPLTVIRPSSMYSRVTTVVSDIDGLNSKISEIKGDTWVLAKIALAKKMLLNIFEGRGILAHRIDQVDLDDAVMFLTGAIASQELMSESGDVWSERAEDYKESFDNVLNKYAVGVDSDGDGNINETEQLLGGPVYVSR